MSATATAEIGAARRKAAILGSQPVWFVIADGEHGGRLHLSGWMGDAVGAGPGLTYASGPARGQPIQWYGQQTCPRCFATVSSEAPGGGEDLTKVFAHEWWHHETGDFPCPPDLIAQATRP